MDKKLCTFARRGPRLRPGLYTALALTIAGISGCTGAVKELAREVTPAVVAGAIEGMSDPESQRTLANNVDEAAVREGARRLSGSMVDGTLDMLDDEERKERLAVLTGELRTATENMIQASIDGALDSALSPRNEARIRALVRRMVADVVATGFAAVGGELGPAEERMAAVGKAAREITRQVTLGLQDAVNDTHQAKERGELRDGSGSVLSAVWNLANSGGAIVYGLGAGVVLLFLVAIVMFLTFARRLRLHKAEVEERDAALLLVAEAIRSTEGEPWARDLHRSLRNKLQHHAEASQRRKSRRQSRAGVKSRLPQAA
jgi:hypothetical protein